MDTHKLTEVLRRSGFSTTRVRLAVYDALQYDHEPIAVSQLAHKISSVDPVSVYRTIELFEKIGVVHRVWTGFKSKIELSDIFSPHHHHFTCLKCGQTTTLESEELETALHKLEGLHKLNLTNHSVELTGYCQACSPNTAKQ